MRMTTLLLVMTTLGMASAARAAKPVSCSTILISADEAQDDKPGNGKQFKATQILDLKFRAVVPGSIQVGADDIVTFKVTAPSGSLYQQLDVPVVGDGSSETERTIPGYPFPIKTQKGSGVTVNGKGAQAFAGKLLVAGTQIMENGLYGTWTVQASLSGGAPCKATFKLQP